MAAILGLRDTSTDVAFRFENYRRGIFFTFPNGKAPLMGLISLTQGVVTDDVHFNWFEKDLAKERSFCSANYNNIATTVNVVEAIYRVGHMIANDNTGEQMLITAIDPTGLILSVYRGQWGVAVASATGNDPLTIIGNTNAEGADTPQILSYDPVRRSNFTQIFRTSYGRTMSDVKTSLKYDKTGPMKEAAREALSFHSIEMEKAFIFGTQAEFPDPATGDLMRTTGGIISQLPASNIFDIAGTGLTMSKWDTILEQAFRLQLDKNNEKLALCGSGALSVMNTMAKKTGRLNLSPVSTDFGMQFQEYTTPFGTVYFKTHPLFTQHPIWRYWMLILDLKGLYYRYLTDRDTQKLIARQNPGADKRVDEFLTECGLEFHHVNAHTLVRNVRCFDPVDVCVTSSSESA